MVYLQDSTVCRVPHPIWGHRSRAMSVGSWVLLVFGIFTFMSFLGALAEEDRVRWPALRRFRYPALIGVRPPSLVGSIITLAGGLAGLFIAGYTGVLLAVTNRPIWSDTTLIGMLFIVSAASTSAALLLLLAHRSGRLSLHGAAALRRMDNIVLVIELFVLMAVAVKAYSAMITRDVGMRGS